MMASKEPPQPLVRPLPRATPFPIDALGTVLADAVRAIHDKIRAPLEICAQSVLATTALAVQGHGDVELPFGTVKPVSEYFATIAATGERKTSADDEAMSPVRLLERQLEREHNKLLKEFEIEHGAWSAQRAQILRGTGTFRDKAAKKNALLRLGSEPIRPVLPMLTSAEPTFEGLVRLFRAGRPSQGIFTSEGGQFLGGYAMKDENRLFTISALSDLWDGKEIKRVRQGDGSYTLRGRRLSVHLLVQPGVSAGLFGDRMLTDQGITTRILAVMPETAAGTRLHQPPNPSFVSSLSNFSKRILEILNAPLTLAKDPSIGLLPLPLSFSESARGIWYEFADEVERQLGPSKRLAPIRGFANKAPEHAARLAGILSLFEGLDVAEIDEATIQSGIEIIRWYLEERLRIESSSSINTDLQLAEALRSWLLYNWIGREKNGLVSLPDVYQFGPHGIRDKETAKKTVGILVEHGLLEPVENGAAVNGTWRREVWRVRGNNQQLR